MRLIPYTTLSDSHVTLRPFQFDDAGELYKAVRESLADLKPWMSWAHDAYSPSDATNYITLARSHWGDGSMYSFAVTDRENGVFLGTCGLSYIHPVYAYCNLGYWIRTSQRGRSLAVHAARLAAGFAFEKLNMVRVEIVVAEGNESSLKVAGKLGAQREGLLRNRIIVGKDIYNAVMFSFVPEDFSLPARPEQ